jgi:hypothetical protein
MYASTQNHGLQDEVSYHGMSSIVQMKIIGIIGRVVGAAQHRIDVDELDPLFLCDLTYRSIDLGDPGRVCRRDREQDHNFSICLQPIHDTVQIVPERTHISVPVVRADHDERAREIPIDHLIQSDIRHVPDLEHVLSEIRGVEGGVDERTIAAVRGHSSLSDAVADARGPDRRMVQDSHYLLAAPDQTEYYTHQEQRLDDDVRVIHT